MKMLIIHPKLSQPSLSLQQQSHSVHQRLHHKLSCLSGQTQTLRQKRSRDCSSTFWVNSLLGSLSPDEWWQPISQHPQNSPDKPGWSWCCRLPSGSAPCRVKTFLLAAREHLHAQKVSSMDRLAAAVGTVTHGAPLLQESSQAHTHPHVLTHKHTLSLSLSLFLSMQSRLLRSSWWESGEVECVQCVGYRREEGKGGGGGGGGMF